MFICTVYACMYVCTSVYIYTVCTHACFRAYPHGRVCCIYVCSHCLAQRVPGFGLLCWLSEVSLYVYLLCVYLCVPVMYVLYE